MAKKESVLRTLLRIFLVTFKIGAFTFGGGYAMIPFMQDEFVDKYHWIEEKDIVDVFAVAQSLPGVIAVNSSLLIGYKIAGLLGGLTAVLGVILPSLFILSVITLFYNAFITNPFVAGALRGISAAVVALMLSAVLRLRKQSLPDTGAWLLASLALGISILSRVSAVYIILGGGMVGLLLHIGNLTKAGNRKGDA